MGFLGQKWECLGKAIFWGKNGRFRTNKMGFLGPKLGILCQNLGFLDPKLGFWRPKFGVFGAKIGDLSRKNWDFLSSKIEEFCTKNGGDLCPHWDF